MYIKTSLNISDHSSVKRNSVHTTPHILYIYSYILLYISLTLYLHTYIHILEVSMHMITLLIAVASLTLVECYSTKSEFRFGYGLLYEHRGQLLSWTK